MLAALHAEVDQFVSMRQRSSAVEDGMSAV